ncbi:hypothetical protein [Sulfurimonas sp.]
MTSKEYEMKHKRLSEIEKTLERMAKEDEVKTLDISSVITLRNEAREIVKDLNKFIQENFKN